MNWFKDEDAGAVISTLANVVDELRRDDLLEEHEQHSFLTNYFNRTNCFDFDLKDEYFEYMVKKLTALTLVRGNYGPAIEEALHVFDSTNGRAPAALRKPIFTAVAQSGSDKQFEVLMGRLNEMEQSTIKDDILYYILDTVDEEREKTILGP